MKKVHHGGNIEAAAAQLGVSPDQINDFSANINPLGFPASLRPVLLAALKSIEEYPDPSYPVLRSRIADQLGVGADDVFVGNGATQILDEALRAAAATDALVLAPTFGEYERLLRRQGIKVHHFQLAAVDNFMPNITRMIQVLRDHPEITTICLTNPNNPTGQLLSSSAIRHLVDFCNQHARLLVLDEAFIDLTLNQATSFIEELTAQDQVYIVRAATKFFDVPGLRLGYGLTKNAHLKALLHLQEDAWSVNALADHFGQVMFTATDYIQATHRWLNTEQPWLYRQLKAIKGIKVYPSMANFFLFDCADSNLRTKLLQEKVLIRQCDDYHNLGSNYFRVAVKDRDANQQLIAALRRVLKDD